MRRFFKHRPSRPPRAGPLLGLSPGTFLPVTVGLALATALAAPVAAESAGQAVNGELMSHGIEVEYAVVPASMIRNYPPGSPERRMHGGVPRGAHAHHFMIALFNEYTHNQISDARISARITELGANGVTKVLQPMTMGSGITYGNYFNLWPETNYRVTMNVTAPELKQPLQVRFEFEEE